MAEDKRAASFGPQLGHLLLSSCKAEPQQRRRPSKRALNLEPGPRAVVASAVGGIQDQIVDGESGILLADPSDLKAAGHAATELLADPARSARIGQAARERVGQDLLTTKHLVTYLKHFTELIRGRAQH
jgi:hypothetical protein